MLSNPPSSPFRKGGMGYLSLILFFILMAHPSSSNSPHLLKYNQVAMGTVVEITLTGDDEVAAQKAALQALQEIKRIEYLMSPWVESSDVSRINRSAGKEWVDVSSETIAVIKKAQEVSELSEGAFDITVGPLVHLWRKAREKEVPPDTEEIRKIRSLVDYRDIRISNSGRVFLKKKEMSIDLGGIAKGYAVDRAFELLRTLGYKNLIVNAGGDLRVGGSKWDQPWSIGIQHPRESQKIMARISISDAAIATSGDYEKFFMHQGKRYHHIFNPRDGLPAEGCQSVTIICKDGVTADAFATAVFVLGPEKGTFLCQRLQGVECLIVDKDGKTIFSPGLKDRIQSSP